MSQEAPCVILVEDDDALREATAQALEIEGFAVRRFGNAEAAFRSFNVEFDGVVVTDIRLPGLDGLELFDLLRERDAEVQVILTTGHGDVPMAVEAMKRGAVDFLTKPFATNDLVRAVRSASDRRALIIENRKLRQALRREGESRLIGASRHAERLRRIVAEVALADVDLVVTGAAGTGKNFVARLVHDLSPRQGRPFVVADPAILTHEDAALLLFGRDRAAGLSRSGLIERAQGGTLVIDGLEAIPHHLSARIYSLLESRTFLATGAERPRTVDLRVIVLASDDHRASSDTASRMAQVHRIGGIALALPSLAERREDIPELFRHFVRRYESESGSLAPPLNEREWAYLSRHSWPGNIRELSTFARNFVLGLTRIDERVATSPEPGTLREALAGFERAVLIEALREAGGRIPEATRSLGIPRKTLYDKLAKHALKPADFRA